MPLDPERDADPDARSERERQKFRAIFDAEPHPVMVLTRDNRLVECNAAARRMLGEPTPFGHDLLEDVLPQHLETARTAHARALAGEPTPMRIQVRTPDGTLRWVHSVLAPVRGADGTVEQLVVIARDVTAEVQQQAELNEKVELLETILAHIPVMIAKLDANATPTYFNREMERVMGWNADAAAAQPDFHEQTHPDPEDHAEVMRFIARGDSTWTHFRPRARDGREVDSLWFGRRLADGSLLAIGQDLTDRLQLEQQLLQSQRLDSIGRLSGGVAHDFNNLLTVILGYSEMLAGTMNTRHPGREMLEEIRRSATRARDLTSQLLAFARRQVIRPRRLELDDLVRDSERMLRRLIGEDIHLSLDLASGGHLVRVDPAQMEQVLLNLAINARDAMPRGGRLTIETASVMLDETYAAHHDEVRAGPYVCLVVSDIGEGMSTATLARIFEPFFTTKQAGRGTGLGLATVYGIVRQSGGHIFVYSEPGVGTTFKVFIPEAFGVDAEAEPAARGMPIDLRGDEPILVVEDEAQVRALTARILREAGYQVTEAASAHEALELAEVASEAPRLLLTDVIMPGMSGRDLANHLQRRWPSLRVVYASGYTHNTIVHHGVLDAGVEFLGKPFTPAQLLAKVREQLSSSAWP